MIFLDSNIFMYAAGSAHPHKAGCLALLERIARSPAAHEHCINTEVLQEILHRYRSIKRDELGGAAKVIGGRVFMAKPVRLADLIQHIERRLNAVPGSN